MSYLHPYPQQRTRIKVCGITRLADALAAVGAGVDALGFIFATRSPRRVSPEQAREIVAELPPFISRVGVFVDSSLEEVMAIAVGCGLTQVQLHGRESVEFCQGLRRENTTLSICKSFRVGGDAGMPDFSGYRDAVDSILLDTYVKDQEGGTGKSFDWTLVDCPGIGVPVILAGGLGPDNIQEAIGTVRPYGVDVNSGVESSPGIKDHELLQRLTSLVRRTDRELEMISQG